MVGQAVLTLIRFLEIPIFTAAWGPDLYGQWLIVAAAPAFVAMGDLGFNGAAERHMTVLIAQGRRDEALVFYQSAAVVVGGVGALACLASLLVFLGDPAAFFNLDRRLGATFDSVIVLLVASAAVALMRANVASTFRSEGRYAFASLTGAIVDATQAALCFAVLFSGGGPLLIAATTLICQGVAHLVLTLVARRSVVWFQLGCRQARPRAIRELLAPSAASMLLPVAQALSYQAPRIIIGAALGPIAVTAFVAHRQLTRITLMLLNLNHPILTEAIMAFGRGEFERFVTLCVKGIQSMVWLCGCVTVILVALGPSFFAFWLGARIPYDASLLALLAAATSLEAGWRVMNGPAYFLNRFLAPAVGYVLVNAALVPVGYLATRGAGQEGMALAILAGELAMGVVALQSGVKVLRLSGVALAGKALTPPLWLAATAQRVLSGGFVK